MGLFLLCGCATFGTFPKLKKGESSREEVRSMFGEPTKTRFEGDQEVWEYAFIKKGEEQAGNIQTVLNLGITFKEKEVDNYTVSVSKETLEQGRSKIIEQNRPLSAPGGQGPTMQQGRGQMGDFIQQHDRNGDGLVSKDEFPGPDQLFNKIDANADGFIDEGEAPQGPPPARGGKAKW